MSDLIDRQATQPDTRDTNVGNTTTKNVICSPVQMAMDYAVNATDFSASSDTISRQAAIDVLDAYQVMVENGEEKPYAWARLRMSELPSAQPEQRWIPWSSGKLPEESGTYTVTAYDGVTKRVTYAKYQKRLKRWELTGARAYWRVLAWMPLPEPYREEGE